MLYQMAILLCPKFLSRTLEKWSFMKQSFSFSHINVTFDKVGHAHRVVLEEAGPERFADSGR